jgi:hypothetical protein
MLRLDVSRILRRDDCLSKEMSADACNQDVPWL